MQTVLIPNKLSPQTMQIIMCPFLQKSLVNNGGATGHISQTPRVCAPFQKLYEYVLNVLFLKYMKCKVLTIMSFKYALFAKKNIQF
uniref:Uncharacterized protein n=1 Tax=Pyxicephalus adspersus TaxID=30357 RepID=A0AAV3APB4_PYXAD|nr:TPA: hypothetical protein GDO54_010568 [Pyxicephalus adspersus]